MERPQLEWETEADAYYTLLMFDPDASPMFREVRHWLVMNIPGTSIDQGG